jgi:hypothetical protein
MLNRRPYEGVLKYALGGKFDPTLSVFVSDFGAIGTVYNQRRGALFYQTNRPNLQ